jgi:hypothetical protein
VPSAALNAVAKCEWLAKPGSSAPVDSDASVPRSSSCTQPLLHVRLHADLAKAVHKVRDALANGTCVYSTPCTAPLANPNRFTQLYLALAAAACSMLRCSALCSYGRRTSATTETSWA